MGTLYVDRRGVRLEFDRGAMVIRESEGRSQSVPLRLVDRLVVVGDAKLSAGLLTRLADNGSSVTLMPGRSGRRPAFLQGHGHGDVLRRIGQYRLVNDPPQTRGWAQRLVWLRIAGQRRLLTSALSVRPDCRRALKAALDELQLALFTVRCSGTDPASLRGREGAATAAFFRGYRALFPDHLGFTGRNRRPPRDPVNAALSLGYTLVHGEALRAITASGLDPMMGVLHEPLYGRDSLACDLAEVARARVERMVWRMFADRLIRADSFSATGESVLLGKTARRTFFSTYEQSAAVHRRWLARMARFLARECSSIAVKHGLPEEVVHGSR